MQRGGAATMHAITPRGTSAPRTRTARLLLALAALSSVVAALAPSAEANLLRNGSFQDDWITRLPETKNHHWCYASEYQNRRDYNPDGWALSGSWSWENADAPAGQRRFVLRGPRAEALQRVNWVLVHDDSQLAGFPDAGGFPAPAPQRSTRPLLLVRDFRLRAKVRGEAVPRGAGSLELFLEPPAPISSGDPIGGRVAPTVKVSIALPAGTYPAQWVELSLPAARWLDAAGAHPPLLPGAVGVALRYEGSAGRVEVEEVELLEPGPGSPNLLANGSFEGAGDDGYPAGWSRPQKYRYFPPRHYYIANTWHNAGAENRGLVAGDTLLAHAGARSLKMVVPAGDESFVDSPRVVLNQREPRLLEVSAWVLTDQLNMLQIDVVDERGDRLPGFNFIHKAPVSIGTNTWRRLRQVLRPRRPAAWVRVRLAARGVNGYTLDDTGVQPQNSAVGTVFWDDVSVSEPETSAGELQARGVMPVTDQPPPAAQPRLRGLDLGERLLGDNVLSGVVTNPGPRASFTLLWEARHKSGEVIRGRSEPAVVAPGGSTTLRVPYRLPATPLEAYTEYRGTLTLVGADERPIARSDLWFSPWSTPIDLELGALYVQPESTTQLVRVNLGFAAATLASSKALRIELLRRGSRQVLKSVELPADLLAIRGQRERIPVELREDFTNLLLADLDVSGLPVQPFADPQRNWLVRASALDAHGGVLAQAESAPFCRQAHEPRQPPVESVRIEKGNLLFVNGRPYMPWGAIYGHIPVYAGPAEPAPGRQRDLHNLPEWSIYDGWSAETYDRARFDFNCDRHVAGRITPVKQLEARWASQNLYASTAFVVPGTVFSVEQLEKTAGGKQALDAYLEFCRRAPMVVSVTPGIEEAFGLFQPRQRAELAGLRAVVELLRRATGKPVMVGHGGYWNRFEFEKVPFFDVFDPETEPFYPANLHTDLLPLIGGEAKAIWLRPQMYEDVPYERWRFHAFVELMRGARGWQFAHGPGDASLFRGLRGELERLKPAAYSREPAPEVRAFPALESWARRHEGRTYVIAATTHGLRLGQWHTTNETGPFGRARVTESGSRTRNEANAYGIGQEPPAGPALHGVQYLPDARVWPGGTRLVQWLRLDPQAAPSSLAMLVKAGGRWTHVAAWGDFDAAALRRERLGWFLRSLYRHAPGFLGWDDSLLASAAEYAPASAARQGALPERGRWQRLEVALDDIGATNTLVDGVAFLHEGGRVSWGRTSLIAPGTGETVVLGDREAPAPEQLARTRIEVAGLKAGTPVRVLFEDRTLVAGAGHFVDDFRGRDLYQRYGGGSGYGDLPVALHIYEIPGS